jgi:hypothetical protein
MSTGGKGAFTPWSSFMEAMNVYRAKAFECLSLAEWMNNPEKRAEMVRFARVWMKFTEPIAETGSAYELLAAKSLRLKGRLTPRGIAWH